MNIKGIFRIEKFKYFKYIHITFSGERTALDGTLTARDSTGYLIQSGVRILFTKLCLAADSR